MFNLLLYNTVLFLHFISSCLFTHDVAMFGCAGKCYCNSIECNEVTHISVLNTELRKTLNGRN